MADTFTLKISKKFQKCVIFIVILLILLITVMIVQETQDPNDYHYVSASSQKENMYMVAIRNMILLI